MSADYALPMGVLRDIREDGGLNQAELAARMGVSQSVLSRMEKDDVDKATAVRYLKAVGTDSAAQAIEFYDREWVKSERPHYDHPERNLLWSGENALQLLSGFEEGAQFDPILARPLNSLRQRLLSSLEFLRRLDHSVAWIGSISVGKTTALARSANLVVSKSGSQPESVFPVGKGRTTVCEVVVKSSPAFGIVVEALSLEETRALVTELVEGLTKETGVTSEIDRVIRSMADLNRRTVMEGAKRNLVDPIKEMLAAAGSSDEVITQIMLRMNMPARDQNELIYSDKVSGGLEWLSRNVEMINFGQHPKFAVPARITVLLPSKLLRDSEYEISVVDTKGVEGTTQRPDLQVRIDDPRAVVILCSRFEDAPSAASLGVLQDIKTGGSDTVERGRAVLLVLPRGDEAIGVRGDSDETSTTKDEGYFIREDQIGRALATHGLPAVPIAFYDALRDNPSQLWTVIDGTIDHLRGQYRSRLSTLVAAASSLVENSHIAKSQEARIHVSEAVERMRRTFGELPPISRPAHHNLIDQITRGHASSVAAAMTRHGNWYNFSVHHMLGVGVRGDANARTTDMVMKMDGLLEDLGTQFEGLPDVSQMLSAIRDELPEWRQEFLAQAAQVGSDAFRSAMDDADTLWRSSINRWGQGGGYRDDIADTLRTWFEESPELQAVRRTIDKALQSAWTAIVVDRLAAASRVEEAMEEEQ